MTLSHQQVPPSTRQVQTSSKFIKAKRQSLEATLAMSIFQQRYDDQYRSLNPYPLHFFEQNLLRITMSLRPQFVSLYHPTWISRAEMTRPIDAFGKLNHLVMQKLIGKKYNQKKWFQPVTLAWVDFEGSRTLPTIQLDNVRFPHVHAVSLCPPIHTDNFAYYCSDPYLRRQMPAIESVKVERFNSNIGSLLDFVSYCSKGYEKLAIDVDRKLDMRLCATFPS